MRQFPKTIYLGKDESNLHIRLIGEPDIIVKIETDVPLVCKEHPVLGRFYHTPNPIRGTIDNSKGGLSIVEGGNYTHFLSTFGRPELGSDAVRVVKTRITFKDEYPNGYRSYTTLTQMLVETREPKVIVDITYKHRGEFYTVRHIHKQGKEERIYL